MPDFAGVNFHELGAVRIARLLLDKGVGVEAGIWNVKAANIFRISKTSAVPVVDKTFNYLFGSGNVGPIPVLVFWMLALAVLAHIALRDTPFGQKVLATGGAELAARYSGVNTRLIKFQVLLIAAIAAALAGMLYAGRLQTPQKPSR